jgi:hypothetical protein
MSIYRLKVAAKGRRMRCKKNKKEKSFDFSFFTYARSTLFERRHFVQILTDFTVPSTLARTFFILAFQALFDFLFEWLTCKPKFTALSQISHFAIIEHLLTVHK